MPIPTRANRPTQEVFTWITHTPDEQNSDACDQKEWASNNAVKGAVPKPVGETADRHRERGTPTLTAHAEDANRFR